MTSFRSFQVADIQNVFKRQWLEVELVGGVIVGRDGLRIAVDHDRLVPFFGEAHHAMDAAVVKLNPLSDAVRSTTQDDDFLAVRSDGFVFRLVRGIMIGSFSLELRTAGVDRLVDGEDTERFPEPADFRLFG